MPDISQINLTDENTNTSVVYNLRDDGVPHSSLTPVQSGLDLSLVTTGEKYTWNDKSATAVSYSNTSSGLAATDVQDAIDEVVEEKADRVALPPAYDPTSTYGFGDVVTYNNAIYQCNTFISTAEAWNSDHWDLVTPDTDYLHSVNPNGYGSFSLNRKANTIIGTCSFAEGYNCTARGNKGSHAEGYNTTASTSSAHAEGDNTTASGNQSHAEGLDTVASGHNGSHAEGRDTTASGTSSHAEGSNTVASGIFSHSEGLYTTANHKSQHTFGEYNVLDGSTATASNRGNYVEIVGNGTANDARSNARTLDWSGNEVLAGGLKINGTEDVITTSASASSGGTDLSLVTTGEKYIWNNKSDLQLGTTSTTALRGDTTYAGSSTAGGSATSAAKLDTATAGSATQPCYFSNGVPSACTYSLNKTVPSNAVFTDTQVTQSLSSTNAYYPILFSYAGNADKTANVTNICYRNNSVYINPSTGNIRATTFNGYTLAGACAYSATTSVASGGGALVTSGGVYTAVAAKQNKITRTSTSRYFTSKTSMAYTGLSLTCPANHIYLVQAWFRYANGAPRYVGACHSSTTYAFYDCVAASTDAGTTNAGHSSLSFILTPGETIYYWAMYYNATQNFISESVVDITIS